MKKIVHQIWIGGSLPEEEVDWRSKWVTNHPDWNFILWDDQKISEHEWYNNDILHKQKTLAGKVDILRYEILYNYGGVYIDTDFECIGNLNMLDRRKDFITALQSKPRAKKKSICNGFMASIAKGEFVNQLVKSIPYRHTTHGHHTTPNMIFGPEYITDMMYNSNKTYTNIQILPSKTFYPGFNESGKVKYNSINNAKKDPNCIGLHHWRHSWSKRVITE